MMPGLHAPMEPVVKPRAMRDLGPVDITPLKAKVARVSDRVWTIEDDRKENRFACFHSTRHIIFRFIDGLRDRQCFTSNPIWYAWQDSLLPILVQASAPYQFRRPVYPKVMLARLAAGASIPRHVDGPGANPFTHKIHVPIETTPQAVMFIQSASFHLEEGRAYEVNNLVDHGAENRGLTDRIHLIFEVFDDAPSVPE